VIPALETAHAFGYLHEHHEELGERVVLNVSGRGDKDLETAVEETMERDLAVAPDMSIFRDIGGGGL
jgi:tryptophan synthase beta chain